MKILGWMHRKLRQHSSESPVRAFAIGQPSVDDQQFYWKHNGLKPARQNYRDYNLRKSFAGLDSTREEEEEEDSEEDQLTAYSDRFHGFLAIGTLGGDPTIHDTSTPKFSISIESMTENENDVTEIELKQFNDELERVLGAEAKEDISNNSSRRNSYVSTGRSSYSSAITLSEKPMEGTETNVNVSTNFPLKGYLFGSGIEVSETAMAKREDRASLGELFQRTKLAYYSAKYDRRENGREKEEDKSGVRLMKKILRKKIQHASKTSTGVDDPASSETKLHKTMNMFHRKVHPENSEASTQNHNKPENKTKNKISYGAQYINGDQTLSEEENILIPQIHTSKRSIQCYRSQFNQAPFTLSRCDSNENKEYWIKTDLDYLGLEL